MPELWTPSSFSVNRMRAATRTVTLPDGKRAKVTVDDSGTVRHRETDDRLDAKVTPSTIKVKYEGDNRAAVLEAIYRRFGEHDPVLAKLYRQSRGPRRTHAIG